MSLEDKIRATVKGAEGKLQAAAGELSGDERLQAEGEAKQLEAKVMEAAGDLKDKAREAAGAIGEAIKDLGGQRG
ncbi:MAG: hypothetical protein ER33_04550 [Cyanobium sp. CACIAM 14]|nr:MAG: hypothetical protein ER33_04550 [Cyanobium sp. CACIAM 14]